jgi:hypothetical protein
VIRAFAAPARDRGRAAAPVRRVGPVAGLGAVLVALLLATGPAAAHHVGTWTPRDNEISANFKQVKFALQAGKFEVARRLYEAGALRRELQARAAALPPGLDARIADALARGDGRGTEDGLTVFFAALVRDLAQEAERQVGAPAESAEARAAAGRRFLEAIWRYYNLVDFAVTQRDARIATTVRLAFDEAEALARGAEPERLREPLRRIARALTGLIETSAQTRRDS